MLEEDGIENPQILLNEMNRHIKKKQREFRDLKRASLSSRDKIWGLVTFYCFFVFFRGISLRRNNSF
jgi:hypothetical protein